MLILLCLSATLHAVIITYAFSEKYEARAVILIKPQKIIGFPGSETTKELLDFPMGSNVPYETSGNTFTELIQSRTVSEHIVRNLDLHNLKRPPSDNYLKELWLTFKDEAKKYAADAWDIIRFGRTFEGNNFDKTVENIRKKLTVTPTENSFIFEISHEWKDPNIAALVVNEASKVFMQLLSEITQFETSKTKNFLAEQVKAADQDLLKARQKLKAFKEKNKSIFFQEEFSERIKIISDLEGQLEKTDVELAGLLRKFSTKNPQVLKLAAERKQLIWRISERKKQLKSLPLKEYKLANLELDVSTLENSYELLSSEYEEAKIQDAKNISDIRVISEALPPLRPMKPVKVYYAALAFLMALIIGAGFAFFVESVNTTLGNVQTVEQSLQLPVLGTIPPMPS